MCFCLKHLLRSMCSVLFIFFGLVLFLLWCDSRMASRLNIRAFQQTKLFLIAAGSRNNNILQRSSSTKPEKEPACSKTERLAKKLREKTPIGKLDELDAGKHPYQEKEPLPPWPDNTNPHTGEVGGPRGPEPTRYGDWERKGRVTDF